MKPDSLIKFSGGGSSSGGSRPDTFRTKDTFELILGLGEGDWWGPSQGVMSLYLGNTPVVNANGRSNFKKMWVGFYPGSDQGEQIKPLLGGASSPQRVGVALEKNIAVTRTGIQQNLDFIELRLLISALYKNDEKKGPKKTTASIKVEWKGSSSATWKPAFLTTEPAPPPVGGPNGGEAQYEIFDDNTITDATGAVIRQATKPGAPSNKNSVWLDTTDSNKPYTWNSTDQDWYSDATPGPNGGWSYTSGFSAAQGASTAVIPNWTSSMAGSVGDLGIDPDGLVAIHNGSSWAYTRTAETYSDGVISVDEKITAQQVKEFRFPVDDLNETIDIRVTQLTDDTSEARVSEIVFESFGEVKTDPLIFPNTACLHVVGQASEQLSGNEVIQGVYKTKIVRVPSNFDPATRVYSGTWDGTFKRAWTDSVPWILMDFVENTRYGLSKVYPHTVNKWNFYAWAQYTDQMIPDGTGGFRPRWTFNHIQREPIGAKKFAQFIASCGAARYIDDGNGLVDIVFDNPADQPVALFTMEDVAEGTFEYSYTDRQTRANQYVVSFPNKDLFYRKDKRIVESTEDQEVYGVITEEFEAIGCRTVSEALARARLRLISSLTEFEFVNFVTNRKGRYLRPWDMILVSDENAATGFTGKIASQPSSTSVVLDKLFTLEPGLTYHLTVDIVNPDYPETSSTPFVTLRRQITNPMGTTGTLTLNSALPTLPENCSFAIEAQDHVGVPAPYRILSITADKADPDKVAIQALLVNREKHAYVDGASVEMPNVSPILGYTGVIDPVEDLTVRLSTRSLGPVATRVATLSWTKPSSKYVRSYKVYHSFSGEATKLVGTVADTTIDIEGLDLGTHIFTVVPVDIRGREGKPRSVELDTLGLSRTFDGPRNASVKGGGTVFSTRDLTVVWDEPETADPSFSHYQVEVLSVDGLTLRRSESTGLSREYTYKFEQNVADDLARSLRIRVRSVDQAGNVSAPSELIAVNPQSVRTGAPTLTPGISGTVVTLPANNDLDFVAHRVWVKSTNDINPNTDEYFDVQQNEVLVNVPHGSVRFLRYAPYDAFSDTIASLDISPAVELTANQIDGAQGILDGTIELAKLDAATQERMSNIDATLEAVEAGVANISASVEAAEAAALEAVAQANAAETAKDNSQAASTAAASARDLAVGAQNAAQTARDLAQTAKTAAETARNQAQSAATSASGEAQAAIDAAAQAATDAQAAVDAAAEAASEAIDAAASASAALASEQGASDAAFAANQSATSASASEDAAGQSANAAAASATTANTKAGQASTSASQAATSATNAAGSASSAATQAGLAATARDAAEGFADDASGSATAASNSASSASASADAAGQSATSASTSANTATTKAGEATTKASQAATSASNAAGSASTASSQASLAAAARDAAEGFADDASGSASAAATSASNASASETAADQSAQSATASANTATTKAGEATTSASNAATSASNAAGSASSASTSSSASATARTAAEKAALEVQPTTFDSDSKYFVGDNTATVPSNVTYTTTTWGRGARVNATTTFTGVFHKKRIPVEVGDIVRIRAYIAHVSGTANAATLRGAQYNKAIAEGTGSVATYDLSTGVITSLDPAWYEFEVEITDPAPFFAAGVLMNHPAPYTARQQCYAIEVENITQAKAAEASASAASTSATNAAASETAAGQSANAASSSANTATTKAGEASTSASNAASSASDAAGSASTASTQAGLAATARSAAEDAQTAAENSASAAFTSASNASASADAAGQSANSATNSANTATTKAGEASTSAQSAATSASNAAGSASTASTQAGLATTARNAAEGFASAASTSASNASSSADDAQQSAQTATTQAQTATTKAGQASTSAGQAATSASNAEGSASSAASQAGLAATARGAAEDAQAAAETAANAASTSESNAAASATDAEQFASAASASANTATTKAGEASTSAQSAATSASNAAGSASTATTQAGLAATARSDARQSVVDLLPSTFERDGEYFSTGYAGSPASRPPLAGTGLATFATTADGVRVLQYLAHTTSLDVANVGALSVHPGRIYEASVTHRLGESGSREFQMYLIGLDANYNYVGISGSVATVPSTTEWQTTTVRMTGDALIAANIKYVRTLSRARVGTPPLQVRRLSIADVTERAQAADSASAASTSAGAASASADAASQSALSATESKNIAITKAGEASTSAQAAASSKSDAESAASTAVTQAGLAADSATAAAGSATASFDSSQIASTKADEASGHAFAADSSRVAAETAKDDAVASANAASTIAAQVDSDVGAIAIVANNAEVAAGDAVNTANNALTVSQDTASALTAVETKADNADSKAQSALNATGTNASAITAVETIANDADTKADTALSTAGTASSNATLALQTANTASGLAASFDAVVRAGDTNTNLVPNGYFNFWDTGVSVPQGWTVWGGSGAFTRNASDQFGRYAMKIQGLAGGNNGAYVTVPFLFPGKFILRVRAALNEGSWNGAQVYGTFLLNNGASNGSFALKLWSDPDTAGAAGSTVGGYRYWDIEIDSPGSTKDLLLYLAAHSNANGGNVSQQNEIIFQFVELIPLNKATSDAKLALQASQNAASAVLTAQTTANNAQSTANSAQSTANSANSAASNAQTTANQAQSAASNASASASIALSAAQQANGTLSARGVFQLDVNGRITGMYLHDNGQQSTMKFQANAIQMFDGSTDRPLFSLSGGQIYMTNVKVAQLSTLSANVGVLRTASSGARLEIRDNVLLVYDGNNVLRTRLGLW